LPSESGLWIYSTNKRTILFSPLFSLTNPYTPQLDLLPDYIIGAILRKTNDCIVYLWSFSLCQQLKKQKNPSLQIKKQLSLRTQWRNLQTRNEIPRQARDDRISKKFLLMILTSSIFMVSKHITSKISMYHYQRIKSQPSREFLDQENRHLLLIRCIKNDNFVISNRFPPTSDSFSISEQDQTLTTVVDCLQLLRLNKTKELETPEVQ